MQLVDKLCCKLKDSANGSVLIDYQACVSLFKTKEANKHSLATQPKRVKFSN